MNKHQSDLISQITEKSKKYRTDNYQMSIGEFVNMYEKKEIIINPDFQRLFRWTYEQRVRLIESIYLGIPIPPIFVFQRIDGIWEVVDGLQRVSTILQFVGKLDGYKTLNLCKTKQISLFEGFMWETNEDIEEEDKKEIPQSLKLSFKRSKLNVTIIYEESGDVVKYEVFQRLNTGGSFASAQEIRNCSMVMQNNKLYEWFKNIASNKDFLDTLSLTTRLTDQQYNAELALRFISYRNFEYSPKMDLTDYLDESLELLYKFNESNLELEKNIFEKTFKLLNAVLGESVFKKFVDDSFKGKFLESAFEAIAIGVGHNINDYNETSDIDKVILSDKIKLLWQKKEFTDYIGSGSNVSSRIPNIIPFAKTYFAK